MQDEHADADKARLLKHLGMAEHAEAFNTPAAVVDAIIPLGRYDQCDDTCTVDCGHCKGTTANEPIGEYDTIAKELLTKAKGNLDTAKQLAIKWAQDEFDKVKLSKIQAAALGVDKSVHNKAEYGRIQRDRERINSAMRKQTRGHVATKIAKENSAKSASNPKLDAFLAEHQGDPLVEQMRELIGG